MDIVAELGYAAHWKYKTGVYDDDAEARQMDEHHQGHPRKPGAERRRLPRHDKAQPVLFRDIRIHAERRPATPAFRRHRPRPRLRYPYRNRRTHCIAGKINHRLVPLSYRLDSGDQVEIITSDSQSPQAEWMEFCHTAKAQSRLRSILRKDRKTLAERGEKLYHDFIAKEGNEAVEGDDAENPRQLQASQRERLLHHVLANDEINISAKKLKELGKSRSSLMSKILRNPFASKKTGKETGDKRQPVNRKEVYVAHPDDAEPNYRFDTCCSPIPGDDVLSDSWTTTRTWSLHKVSCPNAMRLKSAFGSGLVATRWGGKADKFIVTISIDGIDRHGILEEITQTVSQQLGVNIRGLNIAARQELFHCDLTVQTDSTETVEVICRELKRIKDIKFAKRTYVTDEP